MNTRHRTRNTFTCTRIISLTALGASASGAFSEVITVDDDGKADFASIQAAVDYASDGDEILVAPGVYTSDHPAHVVDLLGKAITLRSSDGPEVTFIDGEGARRGIACFNGEAADTLIKGFTIENGFAAWIDYDGDGHDTFNESGGGMYNFSSSPTVINCRFENNWGEYGGGIFNRESSPTLQYCIFNDNSAEYAGGAIYGKESSLSLDTCTVRGNTSTGWYSYQNGGGGIHSSSGIATLTDCLFEDNSANYYGGGLHSSHSSTATLTNCTFRNNMADWGGGTTCSGGTATLVDCTFTENSASGDSGSGGGMHGIETTLTLIDCTFMNNVADWGGGLSSWGSSTLHGCTLTGNSSNYIGGGILNAANEGILTLDNCVLQNNNSAFFGAGLGNHQSTIPVLTDTTICENTPDQIDGDWIDSGGNTVRDNCISDCFFDFNDDGVVDGYELTLILGAWGTDDPTADIIEDGIVDGNDLTIILASWGACP